MSGTIISGVYPTGLGLSNASSDNPVTITSTATITDGAGPALVGSGADDWTIGNSGTIEATGSTTASYGIALSAGGTVTNLDGGLVSGVYAGVVLNTAGTVLNQGSITEANTTSGAGVVLGGGGGIGNASVISGGNDGVFMRAAGDVGNQGTITGGAGNGIVLTAGGGVINGTSSVIAGYRMGVTITGTGTVQNAGTIISNQTSGSGYIYNTANHSSTLLDGGVILGTGGVSNAAGGTISSYFFAVAIYGGGSVINHGSINGSSTKVGFGAFLLNGGTVSNAASATIAGGLDAVVAGGTSATTVTNDGMIDGTVRSGVDLLGGGYIDNAVTGTITSTSVGVHLLDAGSLVNAGSIGSGYISVYMPEGGAVSNLGSIVSTHTLAGAGIRLRSGGTVSNETSADISAKWIGVQIYSTGTAVGTVVNQGTIFASDGTNGAAVWVKGPGIISNSSSGTIDGGPYGVVSYSYPMTVVNQGVISGTEFALDMGLNGAGAANRVIVSPGAVFDGIVSGNSPTATAASVLELTAGDAAGGITDFGSKYVNFAQVTLDAGATWSLAGTVAAGQTISFGADGLLTLANPGSVAGTITGFVAGDTIALAGITDVTSATLAAGNLLTVAQSDGPSLTLQFDPSETFTGNSFPYTVADGNTDLIVPCFAAGTRIATAAGELPVEDLRPGDRVISAFGGTVPVVWLGHRRIDCRRHNRPEAVWPVCIHAGAVAPGVPARDLWLSPDHAVYLDDVLIPAACLINGRSIVQRPVDAVTYVHVELPMHDVILAEGLPAESYLDTGNRSAFANAGPAVALHPAPGLFDPGVAREIWEAQACAPQCRHGPALAAVRARLAARADAIARPPRRSLAVSVRK